MIYILFLGEKIWLVRFHFFLVSEVPATSNSSLTLSTQEKVKLNGNHIKFKPILQLVYKSQWLQFQVFHLLCHQFFKYIFSLLTLRWFSLLRILLFSYICFTHTEINITSKSIYLQLLWQPRWSQENNLNTTKHNCLKVLTFSDFYTRFKNNNNNICHSCWILMESSMQY